VPALALALALALELVEVWIPSPASGMVVEWGLM